MLYLLLLLIFVEVVFIILVLSKLIAYKNPLKKIKRYSELQTETNRKTTGRFTNKNFKIAFNLFGKQLMKLFSLNVYKDKIVKNLERADISLKVEEVFFLIFITILIGFCVGILLSASLLIGILLGVLGLAALRVILKYKIEKRLIKANEQLSNALDMISGSLRAGYSFLRSLEVVANEMEAPISKEFSKVIKEVNLGQPLEKALGNLLGRLPSDELDLLVTAVIIQRQVGGNLAEVLDNISGTLRDRMMLKREVKTLTAQGRLSGWIIAILPIVLGFVIFFLDHGYINILFSNNFGLLMLGLAAVNETIGILLIKKIINVQF